MKEKKPVLSPGVNVGFISLLLISMTLCLAIFAALAIVSANADKSLTDRTGETVGGYYAAHNEFQTFLSGLDELLLEAESKNLEESLRPLLSETVSFDRADDIINAQWLAGERLILQVKIRVYPPKSDVRYEVLSALEVFAPKDAEPLSANIWEGENIP